MNKLHAIWYILIGHGVMYNVDFKPTDLNEMILYQPKLSNGRWAYQTHVIDCDGNGTVLSEGEK